jgi:hypothetical protein
VLEAHPAIVALACRQRAKFEGWLKFELAAEAARAGAGPVEVEPGHAEGGRGDLRFRLRGSDYLVELKTANTNYRLPGVASRHRPITKNIAGIVADAEKLSASEQQGLVAFVLFPIPDGDDRWEEYLDRIGEGVGVDLKVADTCVTHTVTLEHGNQADVIVCVFAVPRSGAPR